MAKQKSIVAGFLSGVVGGLAASFVMNEFIAGPGKQIATAVAHARGQEPPQPSPDNVDSTAKVADAVATMATGGQHLTYAQEQTGGSVVHYTFGALMGGMYGALAEYAPFVKAGFGTTFATALFTAADVIAVPALKLSQPITEQGVGPAAEYYAAHLAYGLTAEAVRRLVRLAL